MPGHLRELTQSVMRDREQSGLAIDRLLISQRNQLKVGFEKNHNSGPSMNADIEKHLWEVFKSGD